MNVRWNLADAFGGIPGLQHDWGYSALAEYNGHRILFDAGNDSSRFASNVAAPGVDLGNSTPSSSLTGMEITRTDYVTFGP